MRDAATAGETVKRYLTTEALMEEAIRTVQQMTPEEKVALRRVLNYSLLSKAEKRRIN